MSRLNLEIQNPARRCLICSVRLLYNALLCGGCEQVYPRILDQVRVFVARDSRRDNALSRKRSAVRRRRSSFKLVE